MFIHNINPVLFKLGMFEIRYYGLIYVLGFIIAYFIIQYLAKQRKLNLTKDNIADLIFYLMVGVILGSRLIYCIIYNPLFYFQNPLQIFAVWNGGMSFHGGLIGSIIAVFLFTKKFKVDFYKLADIIVIPLTIALGLGRIANFINGELYGHITNVSWAVKFPGVNGYRHPSQLYESAKNFFMFGVLWNIKDKKLKDGTLFWLFVLMYGILRFLIEFYRVGDYYIYGFSIGQYLCSVMIIVASIFLYKIHKKP